jgi:hypothetical protein
MDLLRLHYFVVIAAEELNFRRAARALTGLKNRLVSSEAVAEAVRA